jgi:hypothetical protein
MHANAMVVAPSWARRATGVVNKMRFFQNPAAAYRPGTSDGAVVNSPPDAKVQFAFPSQVEHLISLARRLRIWPKKLGR